MYCYKVYGITLNSEIELPELIKTDSENPDARLLIGPIPQSIPAPIAEGAFFQASKNDFLLRLDSIGAFRVQNGATITINPCNESSAEQIRLFVLGSALGALLHQKGILAIHGSVVATKKGALIISGKSSSGKSTLAASLVKNGYKFIADDIAALHQAGEGFVVHQGIPALKLWKDVLKKLDITDELVRIKTSMEKFRNPVHHDFLKDTIPPYKIIILSSKNSEGIVMRELKGVEKFEALHANIYRHQYIAGLQTSESHFKSISSLARIVRVYSIQRPTSPLLIDELTSFIIKKILLNPK